MTNSQFKIKACKTLYEVWDDLSDSKSAVRHTVSHHNAQITLEMTINIHQMNLVQSQLALEAYYCIAHLQCKQRQLV